MDGEKRRNHLAPFLESPRPWLVLAKNAVPAAGVYLFSWTAGEVFLQVWFEGVSALAAMLVFQSKVFAARDEELMKDLPPPLSSWSRSSITALLTAFFILLLGIPYWFILLIFSAMTDGGLTGFLAAGKAIWPALFGVLISNIAEEASRGYGRMESERIRLEFDWYFNMHLARICVIITSSLLLRAGLILPLLLGLSYVEIYPMRALRFLNGETALDRKNRDRSPD